jgi:hypothetical protein
MASVSAPENFIVSTNISVPMTPGANQFFLRQYLHSALQSTIHRPMPRPPVVTQLLPHLTEAAREYLFPIPALLPWKYSARHLIRRAGSELSERYRRTEM